MIALSDELESVNARWSFFYRHNEGLWHVGYAGYDQGDFVLLGTQWVHPDESWEESARRIALSSGAQLALW